MFFLIICPLRPVVIELIDLLKFVGANTPCPLVPTALSAEEKTGSGHANLRRTQSQSNSHKALKAKQISKSSFITNFKVTLRCSPHPNFAQPISKPIKTILVLFWCQSTFMFLKIPSVNSLSILILRADYYPIEEANQKINSKHR